MNKYRVRGKLSVDMYVTVEANTEERAVHEGHGLMDKVLSDLYLPCIHLENLDIGIYEAKEIKSK